MEVYHSLRTIRLIPSLHFHRSVLHEVSVELENATH